MFVLDKLVLKDLRILHQVVYMRVSHPLVDIVCERVESLRPERPSIKIVRLLHLLSLIHWSLVGML